MLTRRLALRSQHILPSDLATFQQTVLIGLDGTRPRVQTTLGKPLLSPTTFPQNIKKYYWIHQGATGSYALLQLTTGHWMYLSKIGDQPAQVHLAADWRGLMKYAFSLQAYDLYLNDTLESQVTLKIS